MMSAVIRREVPEHEIDRGAREQPRGGQRHARPFEAWPSDRLRQLLRADARLDRADRNEHNDRERRCDPLHDSSSSPRMKAAPTKAMAATAPTKSHAAQKPKVCTA